MKFRNSIFVAAVTAAAAVSIPASAATIATAMTPLNIRSGPGPEYSVIGAIPDRGQATIIGFGGKADMPFCTAHVRL